MASPQWPVEMVRADKADEKQGRRSPVAFPQLQLLTIIFMMSRALDQDSSQSCQPEIPQVVYEDIVNAICPARAELLEIEFLEKSHSLPAGTNVLIEAKSVAIPKVRLVQAFVIGRKLFLDMMRACPNDKHQDLMGATAVILLMDAEHLTAANTRKRLILSYQNGPEQDFRDMLNKELSFVDSYLTSRSHRHTKSPTLWSHRRWLLSKLAQSYYDFKEDLETVILVAAERHPRNYYAWSHLRWLVQTYGVKEKSKLEILSLIKDWCLRHPADTSGFSFILFYLSTFNSSERLSRTQVSLSVCRDVLGFAVSFKWTHESVWVFLRTLVASAKAENEQKKAFYTNINALLTANLDNSRNQSVWTRARDWCERYEAGS